MKIAAVLPIDRITPPGEFFSSRAVTDMAKSLEDSGFHGCVVTDHPTPTGRWLDAGGHHAQDPFALLAFVAATTRRIMLQTGILVLPYRNPFLTVRSVNTLDALSDGRVILGLGAGYMKGEYKALGADFDNRNDVMDEYLAAMKAAWSGEEFSFKGTGYEALGNRILPLPLQRPHPPLWLGGNSKRAARRAAAFGEAWCPFHTVSSEAVVATARTARMDGGEDLIAGIAYLKEQSAALGRATPPAVVLDSMKAPTAEWNAQALVDQIGVLADMGVSAVTAHIDGADRAEWCENARRYGEEVVARVGG